MALHRPFRLSITARIALLAIALALVSNLVLVGFVWKHTRDVALLATRREMVEQSSALLAIRRDGGDAALAEAVDDRPPGDPSLVIALLDAAGRGLRDAE